MVPPRGPTRSTDPDPGDRLEVERARAVGPSATVAAGLIEMFRTAAGALVSDRDPDPQDRGSGSSGYVCPFCGQTFDRSRAACSACGGRPVVTPDERRVYETVLRLCGSRCDSAAVAGHSLTR